MHALYPLYLLEFEVAGMELNDYMLHLLLAHPAYTLYHRTNH